MFKIRSYLLLFSLGALGACSSSPPDKVDQIKTLQIPLVLPGEKPLPSQTTHIATLYHNNKNQINALTFMLKEKYLQDVKPKDIFEKDSDVQRVFASLSKLEEMGSINQQYLKERNEAGLTSLSIALKPIIVG